MAKWKILKANQEAERAQLNKILAEIELSQDGHEQKLSQTLNRTATLSTVIDDPNSGIRALADAYQNTYARVYELDGSVVALAQDVTVLQARVDDIETGEAGNAEAIQLLTARVEVNEQGISAIASDVTNLEAAVYNGTTGLAALGSAVDTLEVTVTNLGNDVSAVSSRTTALESTVTDLESSVTATASAVDTLESSVTLIDGRVSANSTAVTQVAASAGMDVLDGSFEGSGWAGTSQFQVMKATYETRTGSYALRIGWGRGGAAIITNNRQIPVEAGSRLRVGYWGRTSGSVPSSGARVYLGLYYTNASGQYVDYPGAASYISDGSSAFGYKLFSGEVVVPAGAANLNVRVIATDWGSGWFHVDDVFATRIDGAGQQNAVATQLLQADVDSVTGRVNASWTVLLDVNGYVTGVESVNNGTTSSFTIRADKFNVVSPSGAGLQWTNGNLWNKRGSYSMLAGPDLGENMLFYIGSTPSSPASATKANAIFYVDSSGTGYFAGQVLQGVLRNFNSNTTVSASASVSTGSVSSNNRPVQVSGRFQYQYQQVYPDNASTITLTGGATRATVVLERRYGAASWVELGRLELGGTDTVINESTSPSILTHTIQGQVFGTDVASLQAREYRTRVVSRSIRSHSVTGQSTATPAATQSQYQSIESME